MGYHTHHEFVFGVLIRLVALSHCTLEESVLNWWLNWLNQGNSACLSWRGFFVRVVICMKGEE